MNRDSLLAALNARGIGKLPGLLGIVFTDAADTELCAQIALKPEHLAPNGYLHAGTVVTLADTTCGYGCFANLPAGASGFTTIELKSNHLGTALEGTIVSRAKPLHLGRTTQVWDAVVSHQQSGRTIALFRCTQLLLYPK
ncbi:MAG TPA: PaaI family thioesterase [Steroidobacteraceae bacterium]|nr:PaaI family thioesterase [Steroidobacteraceae bacterium]